MYEKDLALNNLHWLICHKTKPNQRKPSVMFIKFSMITNRIPRLLSCFIYLFIYLHIGLEGTF